MDKILIFLAWIVLIFGALAQWPHFGENHEKYFFVIQVISVGFAVIRIWLRNLRYISSEKQLYTGQRKVAVSQK